jgi:cyclase
MLSPMKPAMHRFRGIILAAALTLLALPVAAQRDFGSVEIKTRKHTDSFYTLDAAERTIGVLTGVDGAFVVEAGYEPLTARIVAAIKRIQPDGRIRLVVNSHVHDPAIGGNAELGKLGVTIMARPLVRHRLATAGPGENGQLRPAAPSTALPIITYDAPLTVHMNGEEIELIPVPVAHTDGDTMVRFRKADVIMSSDIYRSFGYPNIDVTLGGSLKGMLAGLNTLAELAGPRTQIIPLHGEIVTKAAIAAQRDMIMAIRDKVAVLVRQGKSAQEVLAAKPTADFDTKVPGSDNGLERFVNQLYAEIKAGKS